MRNYKDLYSKLRNREIDISENGFRLIDELHFAYYHMAYADWLGECIHMYLARLHAEYPAVYAITIGQFQYFEPFINTFKDPEGYEFMAATVYCHADRGEP